MKRLFYILLVLVVTLSVTPASAQDLIQKANTAYNNGEFNEAITQYQLVADSLGTSSSLFYNIGNSYYKIGELGKAILYYERALKLDPTNEDVKFNLEFVNAKIISSENKLAEANILAVIIESIKNINSSNGWAVIAIISFLLIIVAILLYIFATTIMIRKISFFGGIALFLLMIVANIFAFSIKNSTKEAIITAPSVILSTSPRTPKDKSEEAYLLNEGIKLIIVDSLKTTVNNTESSVWYEVSVGNSNSKSWVNANQVEVI
ncbi:MAG: tetratricopeptide repeat protein [Bacteroidales bacterium]